jgi:hypothetical protein
VLLAVKFWPAGEAPLPQTTSTPATDTSQPNAVAADPGKENIPSQPRLKDQVAGGGTSDPSRGASRGTSDASRGKQDPPAGDRGSGKSATLPALPASDEEAPDIRGALTEVERLTGTDADSAQGVAALERLSRITPRTQVGRVWKKYLTFEAYFTANNFSEACRLYDELRAETIGTRFENGMRVYAEGARQICPP